MLDEIEKAHSDVFNILLQVLDDGRLTDGQGRTVNFTNTVMIMTSNLSVDPRDFFKPEFVNRIDEIVRFSPLSRENLDEIVKIQIDEVRDRLTARSITLEVGEDLIREIADRGYDPDFGARPLRRVVQRYLGDPISTAILSGKYHEGSNIHADIDMDNPEVVVLT